jgi:ABC-type glycerol-3-phosphate transport system permease component
MPGLVCTGLLAFIGAFNEFLFALTFTISDNLKTVPVVISQFSGVTEHEQPFKSWIAWERSLRFQYGAIPHWSSGLRRPRS